MDVMWPPNKHLYNIYIYIYIYIYDIYIVPYSARSCSNVLYNIIIPDSPSTYISTPKGVYNPCCHYKHKALLKYIAIASYQVLICFMDESTSPPSDSSNSIAAHGASNP